MPTGPPGLARRGGAGRLPTQNRDLVPWDEDLGVLGCLPAGEQGEPADELIEDQVEQSQRHGWRSSRTSAILAKPQASATEEVSARTGSLGRCREQDYPDTGAIWIYDVATGEQLGNYELPRFFSEEDHCTVHNYNFVPGVDRDIIVSAALSRRHDRGGRDRSRQPGGDRLLRGNEPARRHLVVVWHNGFIYANDIDRGFDVFSLDHPSVAGAATLDRDNPQTQERLFP